MKKRKSTKLELYTDNFLSSKGEYGSKAQVITFYPHLEFFYIVTVVVAGLNPSLYLLNFEFKIKSSFILNDEKLGVCQVLMPIKKQQQKSKQRHYFLLQPSCFQDTLNYGAINKSNNKRENAFKKSMSSPDEHFFYPFDCLFFVQQNGFYGKSFPSLNSLKK